jgi:hypothetical protein
MAYIIAEPCIGTKDTACVDLCHFQNAIRFTGLAKDQCFHQYLLSLYILAACMKLFAATRSKRKFNNTVSFDEKRPSRPIDPETCRGLADPDSEG